MTRVAPLGFSRCRRGWSGPRRCSRGPRRWRGCRRRGSDEASGSPRTSSLPLNSAIGLAVAGRGEEAVVLLGGQAGHRLEQVGVVGRALLDGPVLHGGGDGVGDGRVERRALLDRLLQGLEDRLGQALPLHLLVEDVHAEQVLDVACS